MFVLPLDQLKEKIRKEGKISDDELKERIKKKMDELAGLISEDGAAHIIANELGIQLAAASVAVKISSLGAGMRNVDVIGKVLRKFEVRTFQSERGAGKVGSFILADETGTIRVALWNEQADTLEKLKEGDVVKIKGAYTRANNASIELHVNDRTKLTINPEGEMVVLPEKQAAVRKSLSELKESDQNVEILTTLVDIYEPRYFTVCPQCGKRAFEKDGAALCATHGTVTPQLSYVVNVLGDDGTDTIRIVLWRSQAERLLNMDEKAILQYKDFPEQFADVKHKLLGEMVKFVGRVQKNQMFDRLEFNAQLVFMNPSAEEELKRLQLP